jgi:hypothetical protein
MGEMPLISLSDPKTCGMRARSKRRGLDHRARTRENDRMRTSRRSRTDRALGGFLAALIVCGGLCAPDVWAGFIGGGGKSEADCYAGLDVTGVSSASGSQITCTEGDPCDLSPCGDGKCTFGINVCANRSGISGCTPPSQGLASLKAAGPLKAGVPSNLTGEVCGPDITLDLKLKKNGQKKNKRVLRAKATAAGSVQAKKDQDSFQFICLPRSGSCPASPSGAFVQ